MYRLSTKIVKIFKNKLYTIKNNNLFLKQKKTYTYYNLIVKAKKKTNKAPLLPPLITVLNYPS